MPSFDIVSNVDLQEVDNAVNSVMRELGNRYDFKGAKFTLEIISKDNQIIINAPDAYKLGQIQESLRSSGVKRGIDPKSFEFEKEEKASGDSLRQTVKIKQGIDSDTAKQITKYIKDKKMKVQASIRGTEVRVESKKRDDLQQVMAEVRAMKIEVPVQFINFRD
jgi:uncharacterized protein YajQ (UPF0234 family)